MGKKNVLVILARAFRSNLQYCIIKFAYFILHHMFTLTPNHSAL